MGQRKNKITKKNRKIIKPLAEGIFFYSLIDNDFEYPGDGEMHYTDFVCSHCGIHENIPTHIVMHFEFMDGDTKDYMPAFKCEKCGHDMYPTYFEGHTGKIYQYKFKG